MARLQTSSASLLLVFLLLLAALMLAVSHPNSLPTPFPALLAAEPGAEPAPNAERDGDSAAQEKFVAALDQEVTQGALRFAGKEGEVVECPLKHTDVQAEISGFLARVQVTQTFHNPTQEKIEAVYVFPLPHEAAVDRMTMTVGDRRVVGVIQRRDEARRMYEAALAQGQTAALLEQERPNIFTQSVGNIAPGQEVKIEISYVDPLRYDLGAYEFSFPMVVGPRYNPGSPLASPAPLPAELEGKVSPPAADTTRVPDASRISPPVLKPGVRNGHDISLSVSLDAGVPVHNLTVPNHQADVKREGESGAQVTLSPADSLPNKDFVLRYDVVGEKPALAVLTHTGKYSPDAARLGEGYVMLMIQPQEDERLKKSPPREIVFLCDISGSMSGQPTAKVREAMDHMLQLCREGQDTVQVIAFASQAQKLFEKPVPVTKENIQTALNFARGFQGSGGTEMLKGVQLAIDEPTDKERVRIVVMLTDGYIGNEAEIIEHVGKNCGDRVRFWCVGIGSSPNMFLVDGVAKQGGGMGKKLGLEDDAQTLAQEAMTRIQRAQLANVRIDWGQLQVAETYPARIPELWAGRPIIVYGRYQGGGAGTITVRGEVEGEPAAWLLQVTLAANEPQHDVLAKVWARQKIEDLMQQDYYQNSPAVEETVTALALDYQLMSQYTSFVAVDAQSATTSDAPRPPRRMLVPVPLPEGTRWEGFFGEADQFERLAESESLLRAGDRLARQPWFEDRALGSRLMLEKKTETAARRLYRGLAPQRQQSAEARFYLAPASAAPLSAVNNLVPMAGAAGAPGRDRQLALGRNLRFADGYGRGGYGGGGYGGEYSGRTTSYGLSLAAGKAISSRGRGGVAVDALGLKELGDGLAETVDFDFTGAALANEASALAQQAGGALEQAQKLQQENKADEARAMFFKAYFFDAAAANVGQSAGETAAAALAAIEELRQTQLANQKQELPALEKRLALVIRDQSVAQALESIALAAGINLQIVRGSLADVAELLNRDEVRITFLDLRGATLAQALDWTLQPARLEWEAARGGVTVRSARRAPAAAPWVYDVSLLALPSTAELNQEPDQQKRLEAAKREADAFLAGMRGELAGATVEWFGPGQLLVLGSAPTHAEAARVLAALADERAEGRLSAALTQLRPKTVQRANERKGDVAKAREVAMRLEALGVHEAFAWKLLAAAAEDRLDEEALAELQIAWRRPETKKLLEAKSPGLVLRSWWAVSEAARALPHEAELQSLAALTGELAEPAAERVLKSLQENPGDLQNALMTLYAALAMDPGAAYRAQARQALAAAQGDDSTLAAVRTLAAALLHDQPTPIDAAPLQALAASGTQGDDLVTLLAMACRRTGGETWNAFRRQQRDLLGKQPLSGDAIVLVNRLGGSRLPLTAQLP